MLPCFLLTFKWIKPSLECVFGRITFGPHLPSPARGSRLTIRLLLAGEGNVLGIGEESCFGFPLEFREVRIILMCDFYHT